MTSDPTANLPLSPATETARPLSEAAPTSRRALLGSAAAAVAGAAAATLASATSVKAANGGALLIGSPNSGSSGTLLDVMGASGYTLAFQVQATNGVGVEGDTSSGIGVHGTAFGGTGVRGHSISSIGVEGTGGEYGVKGALSGLSGYGVYGDGIDTGTGVEGVSSSIGHPGVRGVNTNADADAAGVSGDGAFGPGVKGTSAGSTGVIGQAMTYGVYGQAMTYGVYGTSDITGVEGVGGVRGVHGHSDQGSGVVATTVKGWALEVQATGTGTGVHAESAGGTALDVTGKVVFNRSGRATIASGKSSLVVTVPGGVAATSLCFATLTVYRSGVYVAAVRPNYPAGKMTVYLNKAIGTRTVLSWVVLG